MAQQAPQYVSTDPAWGTAQAPPPATPDPKKESTAGAVDAAGRFLSGAWENLNPIEMARGFYSMLMGKDAAFQSGLKAGQAARERFDAGKAGEAVMALARNAPIVGPVVQKVEEGNLAGAAGNVTGIFAPMGAARLMPKSVPVRPVLRSRNAATAQAMDTVMDAGVPVGLATASGSKMLGRVQYAADAGSLMGLKDWETPVAESFRAMGGRLAEETRPGAGTTPQAAGTEVVAAMRGRKQAAIAEQNAGATELRNVTAQHVEARPVDRYNTATKQMETVMEDMAAPVDLGPAQAALKPAFDRMKRTYPIAKQQVSEAFLAVQNILQGDRYAPLEVVLDNASPLGKLSRGGGKSGARDANEGALAFAYGKLEGAIDEAMKGLGPDEAAARAAFARRNEATKTKWQIDEELGSSLGQPGPRGKTPITQTKGGVAFNRLTQPKDTNIETLLQVSKRTPNEIPTVARGWLEERLTHAFEHGGAEHAQKMLSDWDNLGKRTKEILWPDAVVRNRINDYMLAMKKWADSPNPSGTGAVNATLAMMRQFGPVASGVATAASPATVLPWQAGVSAISYGLHSPAAARALVRGGARVPVRTPAMLAGAANVAGQAADEVANRPVASHAPMPSPSASHEKVVTRADLEAVAKSLGTDVATQEARAKAEGYVIRD